MVLIAIRIPIGVALRRRLHPRYHDAARAGRGGRRGQDDGLRIRRKLESLGHSHVPFDGRRGTPFGDQFGSVQIGTVMARTPARRPGGRQQFYLRRIFRRIGVQPCHCRRDGTHRHPGNDEAGLRQGHGRRCRCRRRHVGFTDSTQHSHGPLRHIRRGVDRKTPDRGHSARHSDRGGLCNDDHYAVQASTRTCTGRRREIQPA